MVLPLPALSYGSIQTKQAGRVHDFRLNGVCPVVSLKSIIPNFCSCSLLNFFFIKVVVELIKTLVEVGGLAGDTL